MITCGSCFFSVCFCLIFVFVWRSLCFLFFLVVCWQCCRWCCSCCRWGCWLFVVLFWWLHLGIYLNYCLHFLIGLFVCFCCFFTSCFTHTIFALLLLQIFREPQFPVSYSSLCFLPAFPPIFWHSNIWLLTVLLTLSFYSFPKFFFAIFCCFPVFSFLATFF